VIARREKDAGGRKFAEDTLQIFRAIPAGAPIFVEIAGDAYRIHLPIARELQRALERVPELLAPPIALGSLKSEKRHVEMDVGEMQDPIRHYRLLKERSRGRISDPSVRIAFDVAGALLLLVVASDAFTNAIEWVGALYGLTRHAVGAVVAAIGSSLPETMIVAVAMLALRDPNSQAIGIGAVIGAPFMLATLVFALIGSIALLRRPQPGVRRGGLLATPGAVQFGLGLFVLAFALAIGASFAPTLAVRITAAVLVLTAYGIHLAYQLRRPGHASDPEPPRLRIMPASAKPPAIAVIVQLVVALGITVVASRWFVASTADLSEALGLSPFVVSLFLSPIATELPEALNVAIWMRRGLDDLAIGNVLGAMIFQTSVASSIALLASPWHLDAQAYGAAAAGLAAALTVAGVCAIRGRLEAPVMAACALFYAAYVVFVTLAH
jgi:cation:H+ antiporter